MNMRMPDGMDRRLMLMLDCFGGCIHNRAIMNLSIYRDLKSVKKLHFQSDFSNMHIQIFRIVEHIAKQIGFCCIYYSTFSRK